MFRTQEIGSIKKPDWFVRFLKNPKISKEAREKARDDLAYMNIRMFEDVGLDYVYDGEARRVEMYEYAARRMQGFEFAGKIRSWDNKYYRKARCTDKVAYLGPYHLDELQFVKKNSKAEIKIPITGPYTIMDWSFNEHYRNREEFLFDVANKIIRPLLKDLKAAGANIIQIDEPALTTHPKEMKTFVEAFNESVKGIGCEISVHICYSGDNYRSLFPNILDLKADQFALEFANRDTLSLGVSDAKRVGYDALKLFRKYGDKRIIGLGVLDVHVDRIEEPELIRDRILYAAKTIDDPNKIYVNPDCGLRTRSRDIAFNKLRNMVKGTQMAREKIQS